MAYILSWLTHDSENIPVDDDFLDENLFVVAVKVPWFADISNYQVTGKVPVHFPSHEKRRIIQQSVNYSWEGNDIFLLGPNLIIRMCVREYEMYDILKACHGGPCGGHFSNKNTTYKVLHRGYYWPTLFTDAAKYVNIYNSCQWMGRPIANDEIPL